MLHQKMKDENSEDYWIYEPDKKNYSRPEKIHKRNSATWKRKEDYRSSPSLLQTCELLQGDETAGDPETTVIYIRTR